MSKPKSRQRGNRASSSTSSDQGRRIPDKKTPGVVIPPANPPLPNRLQMKGAAVLLAAWLIILIALAAFSAS